MKHTQVSFSNIVLILLIGLGVQFNQHFLRWLPSDWVRITHYSQWSSSYYKQGGVWQEVTIMGVKKTFSSSSKTVTRFVQWRTWVQGTIYLLIQFLFLISYSFLEDIFQNFALQCCKLTKVIVKCDKYKPPREIKGKAGCFILQTLKKVQ